MNPHLAAQPTIPVTVFTGYLGSGKTTIILNLVKQLPSSYKVVLLKNEFGDVAVDSELARESNIGVKEYVNGCLCCVLIGKLSAALTELVDTYHPDHIIIETSGSAFPGPIAWEIRKMKQVHMNALVTVIDALNFSGYKDKSYTAKLQTKDTDLILINKHEDISERDLDTVLDDVYELNPSTPKVKTKRGTVNPDVIFGIDTKLFTSKQDVTIETEHADHGHHSHELETLSLQWKGAVTKEAFEETISHLPKEDFIRIKGIVHFDEGPTFMNYVFGRWSYTPLSRYAGENKLVFMGPSVSHYKERLEKGIGFHPNSPDSQKR